MKRQSIQIFGAGLCGSLLSIILARRGFDTTVYECHKDPRTATAPPGRSINLAMSARGIRALKHAGIFSLVEPLLVPMRGRFVHYKDGATELLKYGQRPAEQIYSVSRAGLNQLLLSAAERNHGVDIRFQHEAIAFDAGCVRIGSHADGAELLVSATPVIAADGAGSIFRRSLDESGAIHATETLLDHSYKELTVPPGPGGEFRMEPGALHIWPRGGFMLIALPNPDGDFTLTLFLPNESPNSFSNLRTPQEIAAFFDTHFADVVELMPDLIGTFERNPIGILGTVRCDRWHDGGRVLLVGDAAHAVVPFHGQGMNLAFEDCVVLDQILEDADCSWQDIFARFESAQAANANAIADMALENYVEMRDTVRNPKYVLQKELGFELERRLPNRFIPRYSMVMFHADIPYAIAQQRGKIQSELLDEITRDADELRQIDIDAAERKAASRLTPLS
ncbi:MAG: FAD-dependent oxidoreductase [Woeseia sp.]